MEADAFSIVASTCNTWFWILKTVCLDTIVLIRSWNIKPRIQNLISDIGIITVRFSKYERLHIQERAVVVLMHIFILNSYLMVSSINILYQFSIQLVRLPIKQSDDQLSESLWFIQMKNVPRATSKGRADCPWLRKQPREHKVDTDWTQFSLPLHR